MPVVSQSWYRALTAQSMIAHQGRAAGLEGRVSVGRVTDGKTHGGCQEVGCLKSPGSNWDVVMIKWSLEMMGNLETVEAQMSRREGVLDIRTSQ